MHPKLKKFLSVVLPAAVFAYLFYVLGKHGAQIQFGWETALTLTVATVLCWMNAGVSFLMWFRLLSLEQSLSWRRAYEVYGATVLAKYLPAGKALQFAPFLFYFKNPTERTQAFVAAFLVNALGMVGGMIVALPGALTEAAVREGSTLPLLVIAAAGLLLAALKPRLLFFPLKWTRFNRFLEQIPQSVSPVQVGIILGINMIGWGVLALAQWVILAPLTPEISLSAVWYLLTAYYVASWVGYLAILFPSGIGATEATLYVLLQRKGLSAVTSASVPLLFRVSLIAADLLFVLPLWKTLARHYRKSPEKEASDPTQHIQPPQKTMVK